MGTTDADLLFVKTDRNGNTSTNITEQNKQPSFLIFPNPAVNTIHISSGNLVNPMIEIYNVMGSLVARSEYQNEINISGLAPGIYNVNLAEGNKLFSQRLIKQ